MTSHGGVKAGTKCLARAFKSERSLCIIHSRETDSLPTGRGTWRRFAFAAKWFVEFTLFHNYTDVSGDVDMLTLSLLGFESSMN